MYLYVTAHVQIFPLRRISNFNQCNVLFIYNHYCPISIVLGNVSLFQNGAITVYVCGCLE